MAVEAVRITVYFAGNTITLNVPGGEVERWRKQFDRAIEVIKSGGASWIECEHEAGRMRMLIDKKFIGYEVWEGVRHGDSN